MSQPPSAEPRSGDAFVAPSRPSVGKAKIDRREIFVRRREGGMGLNDVPANIGVEDVGQRIIPPISSPNIHVARFSLSIGGVHFHVIHLYFIRHTRHAASLQT